MRKFDLNRYALYQSASLKCIPVCPAQLFSINKLMMYETPTNDSYEPAFFNESVSNSGFQSESINQCIIHKTELVHIQQCFSKPFNV